MDKELESALRADLWRVKARLDISWAGLSRAAKEKDPYSAASHLAYVQRYLGEADCLERALRLMGVKP